MKTPPVNPTGSANPEALRSFLTECAAEARAVGRPQLVSISMTVENLDPLAVLESIFEPGEPHFYTERPSHGFSVAGAETAVEFTAQGRDRFAAARAFIDRTLENSIAVGPLATMLASDHPWLKAYFGGERAQARLPAKQQGRSV